MWYALFFGLSLSAIALVFRLVVVSGKFASGQRVLPEQSDAQTTSAPGSAPG